MAVYTRVSNYGYVPDLTWNAVFVALFGLSLVIHCFQAWRSRFWIIYATLCLGTLIEVMGYSARLWSHFDVLRLDAFLMQIVLLTFAPVFYSAYVYIVLGTAIHRLGSIYSILPPRLYFITFITADIISLVLQAIGGGQAASTAAKQAPSRTAEQIAVSGIIFQLIVMFVFICCGIDFALRIKFDKPYAFRVKREAERVKKAEEVEKNEPDTPTEEQVNPDGSAQTRVNSPSVAEISDKPATTASTPDAPTTQELRKWWWITLGVAICSTMILLRGFFRSVELMGGYTGRLAQTEIYMAVLDGVPMVIATWCFNIIHPGLILGRKPSWRGYY